METQREMISPLQSIMSFYVKDSKWRLFLVAEQKDLTGNLWAEDKAELALGLPILGSALALSISRRSLDLESSLGLGQLMQLSQISLDSQGNVDVIIVFLRLSNDSPGLCYLYYAGWGLSQGNIWPQALFTPTQKDISELCT